MTKSSITDAAYKHIYDAIVSGRYGAGAPISENLIAKELCISRSPVREVLNRMLVEGFVVQYPGRGTFVTTLTRQDIEEILDLRALFELHAVKLSYRFISDDTLISIQERFRSLPNDRESPESQLIYYECDRSLHNTIVWYCGNQRLINFYKMTEAQLKRIQRITSKDPEHFTTSVMQHMQIINVLLEHSQERAVFYLKEHLDTVKKRTLEMYTVYENASIVAGK